MRWWTLVLIAIVAVLILGGGAAVVMTFRERERKYGKQIVDAFRAAGFDPALGLALARQESGFDPAAANETGNDLARGGAYGLFQMTSKTAKSLGNIGTKFALQDPATNIAVTLDLLRQNQRRVGRNSEDLAAAHNSGKSLADAPSSTRQSYVPRVMVFVAEYRRRIDAGEFV